MTHLKDPQSDLLNQQIAYAHRLRSEAMRDAWKALLGLFTRPQTDRAAPSSPAKAKTANC